MVQLESRAIMKDNVSVPVILTENDVMTAKKDFITIQLVRSATVTQQELLQNLQGANRFQQVRFYF